MGIGFEAGVEQFAALRRAVDPDGSGNKTLHKKTFRRANIRFVQRYPGFSQQLFKAHQLAMGAAVKPVNGLAVEIVQLKRRDAPAIFPA
ncbi:hypothetical protein D3C72_1149190 [compost metagenome]